MVLIESSPVMVAPRSAALSPPPFDVCRSVVWLRGEYDMATQVALSETLARAIADDDADVVVDVSEVTFMGAETVGVLIRARRFLQVLARSLQLRAPSARVMRTLDLCRATWLLDPDPPVTERPHRPAEALGTWVAVPATQRSDDGATSAGIPTYLSRHRRTHVARTRPPALPSSLVTTSPAVTRSA